jgi:selenocysteine-specific elongation factor
MALSSNGLLANATWLSVSLRTVASAPNLPTGSRVMLLFGTEEVEARLRLLDRDTMQPGEATVAQLKCAAPVALPARERFILRTSSPPQTIAGGQVIDAAAVRLRRRAPIPLATLAARAVQSPADILQAELKEAGTQGIPLTRLAQLAGVAPSRVAPLCHPTPIMLGRNNIAIWQVAFDQVTAAIPGVLAPHPQGLPRDQLAALMPWAGPAVLDDAITALVRKNILLSAAGTVRLHIAQQEHDRAAAEATEASHMAEALRQAGLSPPAPETLAPGPQARRLANILVRNGVAIRVPDKIQKRELLFHAEAIESAKRRLAPLLTQPPGLLVSEAGAALGISRKYCVPLLEYLDTIGFTRRTADRRALASGNRKSDHA